MERLIAIQETHQSGSSSVAPECVESPVKIDSISIDLINADDDIDNWKCEHFSIRGYASNMRNKDWKKCWPFAVDGACNVSEEQNCKLPPLLVPKFRWWSCQNCLPEIGAGGSAKERTVADNNSKLKSFCTCPHVSSNGDAVTRLSDLQQARKFNIEPRKHDANTCLDVNSNDCHPLFSDKSKKKAEIANVPIIGKKDVLEKNINKEIHIVNYAGIDVISSLLQQTLLIDDKVASLQLCKPAFKNNEIDAVKHPNTDLNSRVKDATELHQNGKHAPASDRRIELVKTFGSNGMASIVNSIPDSVKTHKADHPDLESDDCDYASSENAEISLGTASGSSHRRKTRKVRLLTELLGKNGDAKTDLMSIEGSPSSAIPDAVTGRDSISAHQGQVTFQGNVTSSLGHSRKRKLPQDEEWRPAETSSPNSGHKNLRTCQRVEETTDGNASSDSESTLDGSVTQTDAKNYLFNIKVDRIPIIRKKKIIRTQNFDEGLPLSVSRENVLKERQKKLGDTSKSNDTDNAPTSGGLDPLAEPVPKAEKKSNLLKKKSKINKNHDVHFSPISQNNGIVREGPNSRRDVEIRQPAPASVVINLIPDASAGKGLHFSLNNCSSDKRYDGKYISPIKDGLPSLLPWQRGVLGEDQIGRKDLKMNYVGDPSFSSKSELDAYIWKGWQFDLNSNQATYRIPFPNEKQRHSSCAEVGNHSLIQQLDCSGTSNNRKALELQDHPPVARKNFDQRPEMVSEQGTLDDVPMEIVELMAKNQYERCLPDTEVNKKPSETTNTVRNHQMVDLNKVYQNEEMSQFHETSQKPKTRNKNGRTGKIVRGDNAESSRQKSVDCFSHIDQNQYKMSQLEQSYTPAGFRAFSLCRDKPLNGIQFPATNSSRQNSAKNCQWIGNMVGQRPSHTNVQALGVCNTCQSAPQPTKEAAHPWPSVIPSNVPYVYRIPQKRADQVVNADVLSRCPNSLPKENMSGNEDRNFLNLASNFEKHGGKFDSEAFKRTRAHADYPVTCKHNGMGSLDLYSNETIPAMHLLSLMDAGLQSGSPVDVDVDGNRRFAKKTSFHHSYHCKEFSSLSSGGYRGNSTKHPSYDCYSKNEKYCECMSAIPAAGPSTSSFQHDKSFKATDFISQISLKSRDQEKKKSSDSRRQNRNHRSRKAVSSTSDLNTTCGSIPAHSMPKLVVGSSDFRIFPIQHQSPESGTRHNQDTRTMNVTLFHPQSGSMNEICSTNRNPADFTIPEAGNVYMIRGEELKFGRETPSSALVKFGGQKRQKKVAVRKEHSRNQTS